MADRANDAARPIVQESPATARVSRLLVTSDDSLGRALVQRLGPRENLVVVVDKSSGVRRIFKLIQRGSLKPRWVARIAWAALVRRGAEHMPAIAVTSAISTNDDLLRIIREHRISIVYLFRAGLIVRGSVLASGVTVFNVHCARLPEFAGLGAIPRALESGALEQVATLHRVTDTIDSGEIIATEPYTLDARLGYRQNEDIAYGAGARLLVAHITASDARAAT